ncbi:SRPBCC domain-containing protein [Actinomadura barringtoniae]|uniref:SRPBCC domain-containing protein n=1 Tax=Actinomadura barringtoniae TaxID=1427535 RepID=A0A939T6V5_9ACTN|nr:SRPBCC domain-containing protein [Actinomadura barringtoniae]MBO2451299.1 SRPBCC domain-containing protein [Actinomadura barringtoniae]
MSHAFELHKEIELAATPEQVWEAIATGPGMDAWFMGRNEIEAREGGTTSLTMAGQTETATVTHYEPGKRFGSRTADGDDGAFMAFEYLIEGREGGSTVLRLVQSGVLTGDWETEYEAMKTGWDMYLHSLGEYLSHFAGQTADVVSAFRPGADASESWAAVRTELGLGDKVAVGDAVRFQIEGLAPAEGIVDYVDMPTFLGVRTGDGLYRFIHSGADRGNVLVLGHHVFGGAGAESTEQAWQSWLNGLSVA